MSKTDLESEFEKRKPWITKFIIDNNEYGGDYDPSKDARIDQFFQYFPNVHTVLELGSLEGGQSFLIAKRPSVKRVLGIEGRLTNIGKAKFVAEILGADKVDFIRADLEHVDLTAFEQFDAVFCVGLLYHLLRPWDLVAQIAKISANLFIWTHYTEEANANKVVNGFEGTIYQEGGLTDPLSGLNTTSFWPTLPSLTRMLEINGYDAIYFVDNHPNHPNGPCVTLAATTHGIDRS